MFQRLLVARRAHSGCSRPLYTGGLVPVPSPHTSRECSFMDRRSASPAFLPTAGTINSTPAGSQNSALPSQPLTPFPGVSIGLVLGAPACLTLSPLECQSLAGKARPIPALCVSHCTALHDSGTGKVLGAGLDEWVRTWARGHSRKSRAWSSSDRTPKPHHWEQGDLNKVTGPFWDLIISSIKWG